MIDALILDLLEWIGPQGRPYAETIDAWRTSCPRLTVWEDTTELGLIKRQRLGGEVSLVVLTSAGADALRANRRVLPESRADGAARQEHDRDRLEDE